MSRFDVSDFEVEKGGWWRGQTHRVATYDLRVFKGAADIKFELWFRGEKRSEERDVKVDWGYDHALDEVF